VDVKNNNMKNTSFKITVKHWDEKITVEKDHSDITFEEYIEMLRTLSRGIGFGQDDIDDIFGS
jgi:hypothetical protein